MKQIYTKTGDEGMTCLRDGARVPKCDPRIETNGQIDQLNAHLGIVRSMLGDDDGNRNLIHAVQRELMAIMSHIATPDDSINPRELRATEVTGKLEQAIDHSNYQGGFVVPGGGSQLAAFIHLARTQARTVERRLWSLHREHPVDGDVLVMMNRLSDYLFVLANEKE
jgi:ATP:cob(I)alamin adenosyltransferase